MDHHNRPYADPTQAHFRADRPLTHAEEVELMQNARMAVDDINQESADEAAPDVVTADKEVSIEKAHADLMDAVDGDD